jgi:hypothetical protein
MHVDQSMKQRPTLRPPSVHASDGFELVERLAKEVNAARPSCGVKAPGRARPITAPASKPASANTDGQAQRPARVPGHLVVCMAKDIEQRMS